jgi:glycosyltransferase involved in cell wall biosynthesis
LSYPKVALISEEFPPFMFGGIGAVISDLADSLSKRKISTTVFCGGSKKIAIEKSNDYLEIVRLPCLNIPPRFLWFQVQNHLNILRKLEGFDIIHAVSHQVSFLSVYLKRILRLPLITSYHGVPFYDLRAFANSPANYWTIGDFGYNLLEFPLNDRLIRFGLSNSDKIIACSRTTLNELSTLYRNIDFGKSLIIPNGINLEKIEKIANSFNVEEKGDGLSLIFIGRLYFYKGITHLIEAFEYLIHDYPSLTLNIFGSGPMKDRIQTLVFNRGLKNKIFLRGQVDRGQLMKEILKSDIAVLPSLREAQPVSVLEAMALRKPVVAFDFDFSRECIRDKYNGFLAKPRSSKDLASKIGTLLSDKKLRDRIGQNGYEYVKQHHNWDVLVDSYIDLYKEVTSCS